MKINQNLMFAKSREYNFIEMICPNLICLIQMLTV